MVMETMRVVIIIVIDTMRAVRGLVEHGCGQMWY